MIHVRVFDYSMLFATIRCVSVSARYDVHMVNHTSILIISVLIIIIPQLGFPNVWQKNITSGLAVLIIALTIRAMRSTGETPSGEGDTYVETSPTHLAAESSPQHHENNS